MDSILIILKKEKKWPKGFICPYTGTIFYNIRIYIRSQVIVYRTIGPLVIAVTLNESIFLDVLHFPMKNIKSGGLEATPMGGVTSKPTSDIAC